MKILIFLFMFLVLGGFYIIGDSNIQLRESGQSQVFFTKYLSWFGSVFDNARGVSGYVIRLDWLPEEGK